MSLIERPLIAAFGAVLLWFIVRELIPDLKMDENIVRTTISTLVPFWVLLTGTILVRTFSNWREIDSIVKEAKNFEKFLQYKDQRIFTKGFSQALRILSSVLLLEFFLLHFDHPLTAISAIGPVAFVLVFGIEVIKDLDDPFTGEWNVSPLPPEWEGKLQSLNTKAVT